MSNADRAGEFGVIYLPALQRIRNLWVDLEPLVVDTSYDDLIQPTELQIELSDGLLDAESARFDIQWSTLDNYTFHYTDDQGLNWRFDCHPNTHSPRCHFHPPSHGATSDATSSCILVTEVSLVTRAVLKMWRTTYETDDLSRLNSFSNPP